MVQIETYSNHAVQAFESGAAELDDWLQRRAAQAQFQGDAVVRVAVTESGRVVGYHALCAASVERALAPGGLRRNAPDPIPVLLLARLAVELTAQGSGVGVALLADVAQRCQQAAHVVGFRALVIHCRNEQALTFYQRWLPVKPLASNHLHVFVPLRSLTL